jgi:hypothetical protein
MRYGAFMYRCYLLSNGRIARGEDLEASTVAEAIQSGEDVRAALSSSDDPLAMEIWQGASLLYHDAGHVSRIRPAGPIISPFDTAPSTMFRTW